MIWWYNPLAFHSHFIMHGPAIDIDWMRLDGDGHMESASRSSSDRRSSRATFVMKQLRSRRSLSHRSDLRDVKSSHPTSNDRRKHTRTRRYSVALIIWNLSHPPQTAVFLVRFEIKKKMATHVQRGNPLFEKDQWWHMLWLSKALVWGRISLLLVRALFVHGSWWNCIVWLLWFAKTTYCTCMGQYSILFGKSFCLLMQSRFWHYGDG